MPFVLFILFLLVSWIVHIVNCILTGKFLLLIAGGFIFPVGIIHGILVMFGFA